MNESRASRRGAAALLLAAVIAAAPAAFAHGGDATAPGYGMGPGMMGPGMMGPGMMGPGMMGPGMMGPGMMGPGMMGPGMSAQGLDLTSEQRAKIIDIHRELHRQHWQAMGQLIEQQYGLQALLDADRPDPKQVAEAYGRIADLRGQMLAAEVDAHNRVRDVLTEAQRARLDEWRHGMMFGGGAGGPGHGMGHGMMMMSPYM
ncbi:MAG: Spy/CpxP family protein refolding chaperone [Gammaproteobacteria bacterium]|nr:Spy/CpxP family protein refolding chaperone [Gammaproteobacteria bacterium]